MRANIVAASILVFLASPAAAETQMTAGQFLDKANALEAKGMMAMLSPDVKILRGTGKAAGKEYRAMLKRQKANGQNPHSCPPGKGKLNGSDMKAHLSSLSAAQKAQPFQAAFFSLMKKKYPCR